MLQGDLPCGMIGSDRVVMAKRESRRANKVIRRNMMLANSFEVDGTRDVEQMLR